MALRNEMISAARRFLAIAGAVGAIAVASTVCARAQDPAPVQYKPSRTIRKYVPSPNVQRYVPSPAVRRYVPGPNVQRYVPSGAIQQYAPPPRRATSKL